MVAGYLHLRRGRQLETATTQDVRRTDGQTKTKRLRTDGTHRDRSGRRLHCHLAENRKVREAILFASRSYNQTN